MALQFVSEEEYKNRQGGGTTTLGKTNKFAPVQFIEPKKVSKVRQQGDLAIPYTGMETRRPLQFNETGQKVVPTTRDWANENVLGPAVGSIFSFDPVSQLSGGKYNFGGALDPFYDYYQVGRQILGGAPFNPDMSVSRAVSEMQAQTPEWVRATTEGLMGATGGGGMGVPHALTPETFARSAMARPPEFMPRPPSFQTPMRDILANASRPGPESYMAQPEDIAARQRTPEQVAVEERISPQTAQRARLRFAQGSPEEPPPGPPPPPSRYKNPTFAGVKADTTAEMDRLERNAPPPAQREASPEAHQYLQGIEARQAESQKYGRGFIGEKGGPDAKWLIERAKQYEYEGDSPSEIWRKTTGLTEGTTKGLIGAFKGKDGKWRVELDDGSLVIEPGYLSHRAVEQRYPGAIKSGNVNLSATKGKAISRARHEGKGVTIDIFTQPERARIAGAHEVQHAIQRQEGFARGGSVKEFEPPGANLLEKVQARGQYHRLEGEAEARLAGRRVDYNRAQRVLEPPFLDYDVAENERVVRPQIELGES